MSDGGFNNWKWGQFGKSVGIGAVSGAVSYGIGSAAGAIGGFGGAIFQTLGHSAWSGAASSINGGSFWSGAATGALSNITAGATSSISPAGQILTSAVMGGVVSGLSGGNFWEGATVGGIVAGANHLMHDPPQKKSSGGPSLQDIKKGPPTHPEYKAPKSGPKQVLHPRGKGWIDKNGDIWVPTDHNGTHSPHWDRQHPNGKHTNMYPLVSVGIGASILYGTYRFINSSINRFTPVLMNVTIMNLNDPIQLQQLSL